jgi:hypothetical protein
MARMWSTATRSASGLSNQELEFTAPDPRDTNRECTPLAGDRADDCHSSQLVDPVWVTELPAGPVVVPV